MSQEGKPINGFIHYCLNCGTQLSPTQDTFRCSNCGSTTFKLKKTQKEVKKTEEEESQIKTKSEESQPIGTIFPEVETTFGNEKSENKNLETVRTDVIGVLEIDVNGLMKGKPLILSVKKGLYEISVQRLMERVKKR